MKEVVIMDIVDIKKDNVEDFEDLLGADISDDMGRNFYRGLGAIDESGKAHGALIFTLKNADNDEATTSRIVLFSWDSAEVRDMLSNEYHESVSEHEIVNTAYETEDSELAGFLESIGFDKTAIESPQITVTVEDLKKIPVNLGAKLPPYVHSLSEISVIQFRSAVKNFIVKGTKGSVDDLAYLPLKWFERDVSACTIADDKVNGMFMIRKTPSGELHPVLYTAFGPEYVKNLGMMLVFTASRVIQSYPPETVIRINRHSKQVLAFTAKMLGGFKGNSVFAGNRDE
ncbi:MAG: hypothetical protein J6N76_06465 [Lachnospiraceae bacterium]|nr:hypothetical protein [Lachnospiraceae bacterium]